MPSANWWRGVLSRESGFGLYVHWPFCQSKCPYCDFNSHVAAAIDQDRWRRLLLTELAWFAAASPGRTLTSIFFGGGTPSLMDPATAAALIEAAGRHWILADGLEVTLEANPSSVEARRFRDFRAAGINRLSLGIQALDDKALRFLGRRHTLAEAMAALEIAATTFPRYSFDLIYARPGQSIAGWQDELGRALALAGEHLSLYQLGVEHGTAFAPALARGDFELPDEHQAAAMFELTGEMTEAAGLPAYEISNHARPGAECRHNLITWRGGDYLGIGPGAHGRLGSEAICQHSAPETWAAAVEADGHGTLERQRLAPRERAEEMVMMGLRLREGIDAVGFAVQSGQDLWSLLSAAGLARLERDGLVERSPARLRTTPAGRLLLNAVIATLLT